MTHVEGMSMDDAELRQKIGQYKFYHRIRLTDTITTPGFLPVVRGQEMVLRHLKSLDLRGRRVLDIGCRDGLFSFAAESLGASEVIGIDNDLSRAAVELLIPFFQSKVRMEEMNLYDLRPDHFGLFDVVIFPGVLYHLRFPFWGLKVIRDIMNPGGHLIVETAIWRSERSNAVLYCPIGAESPYEPTSCTFFNEKGLRDTLQSLGFNTVGVEYLNAPGLRGRFSFVRRIMSDLSAVIRFGNHAPIRNANIKRAVFHATFEGCQEDSFVARYWEKTHDWHTVQTPDELLSHS